MVDIVLVTVTVISLAIASVMAVITWRVLTQERRRADAGVADLLAAADGDDPGIDPATHPPERLIPARRAERAHEVAAAIGDEQTDPLWTDLVMTRPTVASALSHGAPLPDLFLAPDPMRSNGRRLILATGLGSAMLLVVFAIVLALNTRSGASSTLSPAAAGVTSPLELVALDHARAGGRLSIHGLVRNPPTGSAVRDLSAVVFLFDRDGGYLSTIQAPVLGGELAPGGESAFEVPVESGQRVARYRLTFRVAATPVPHVDARASVPAAAPVATRAGVVAQATMSETPAGRR